MARKYVVTVMDFFSGKVDIFLEKIPEEEKDIAVWCEDAIEQRGHHSTDCLYMWTESDKFELNVELK